MRLLISADTLGGVWEYTTTLARAIEADGHTLLVAVIGEPSDEQIAMLPESVAIECRNHPLEWISPSALELSKTADWLAGLARAWHSDVVHLNQMAYPGLAKFSAPTLVVVHSDVASWFREVRGVAPPSEWIHYVRLIRNGLGAATSVAAVSRAQAAMTQEHYGRIVDHVIYNGTDLPSVPPAPRSAPLVLTSGRAWDPAKGAAVLERALTELGDEAPPAHLIGALEGPAGQSFVCRKLRCHGHVSSAEVQSWMSRASVYVAPSLYEPFGLAPVEAALHGCALLLSDIPTFRELWDGAAVFYPKTSSGELARTMLQVLGDPATTGGLASTARHRATRLFTTERFAAQYLQLYQDLAGGMGRSSGKGSPSIPVL